MENPWNYHAVKELRYSPELGRYLTYGIRALEGGRPVAHIHDIAADGHFVQRLAEDFCFHHLSPLHLQDVIEDMLP